MKRTIKNIVAILVSATLAIGLLPSSALAISGTVAVGSSKKFANNTGSTDVYVVAQDTRFRIVDQSKNPTEQDVKNGIWVQVQNADESGAPTVKWFSKKIAQNDMALSEGQQEQSKLEWNTGVSFDSSKNAFYLKPNLNLLDVGGTYEFWAEVTDASGQKDSNEDDPIIFVNSKDYWVGPLDWVANGASSWTWQVSGGLYDAQGQPINGADGKLYKGTSLSAFEVPANDRDSVWSEAQNAAAANGFAIEQVWTLNVADKDELPAFVGTLEVVLDLTEALGADALFEDLSVMWLNPYAATNDKSVVLGSDQSFQIVEENGRTYAKFVYPEKQAGSSGFMGTFALVKPQANTDFYTVQIASSEGGSVSATSITRAEGSTPSFLLFEHSGYRIDGVYLADGITPAPGTLKGNEFTLDPLVKNLSLVAKFAKIPAEEIPEPNTVFWNMTISLAGDAPAGSTVDVIGHNEVASIGSSASVVVDASKAPILHFNAAGSYVADKVTIKMGDETIERMVQGEYLVLPLLTADAQVEVSFRLSGGGTSESYKVLTTIEPAEAANVAASSNMVAKGGAVTFTIDVLDNYRLKTVQITEGGSTTSYSISDFSENTLTIYNVQSEVKATFTFDLVNKPDKPDDSQGGDDNQGGNQGGDGNQGGNDNQGGNVNQGNNQGSNGSQGGNQNNNGANASGPVNNGDTVGDGSAANSDGTFNIKISIKGSHGSIQGEAVRRVKPGSDCTIHFAPEVGYKVAAITIDGTRYEYSGKSFTFQNVRAGHTLQVEFGAVPYTGDNSENARTVRKLQSLAKTGDFALPGILALSAVACGALGTAVLCAGRRKKYSQD